LGDVVGGRFSSKADIVGGGSGLSWAGCFSVGMTGDERDGGGSDDTGADDEEAEGRRYDTVFTVTRVPDEGIEGAGGLTMALEDGR
jgi:hypothetical protein